MRLTGFIPSGTYKVGDKIIVTHSTNRGMRGVVSKVDDAEGSQTVYTRHENGREYSWGHMTSLMHDPGAQPTVTVSSRQERMLAIKADVGPIRIVDEDGNVEELPSHREAIQLIRNGRQFAIARKWNQDMSNKLDRMECELAARDARIASQKTTIGELTEALRETERLLKQARQCQGR